MKLSFKEIASRITGVSLPALFGQHIAYLAVKYGLDIEGDLASILPPDTSEDRTEGRRKT